MGSTFVGLFPGKPVQQKNGQGEGQYTVDQNRDDVRNDVIEQCEEYRNAYIGDVPVKAADTVNDHV